MSNQKIRVTLNVMALLSERERQGTELVREQTGYGDEDGLLKGRRTSSTNFKRTDIFSCNHTMIVE